MVPTLNITLSALNTTTETVLPASGITTKEVSIDLRVPMLIQFESAP